MKCPNCNEELPGVTCPQCGKAIPYESVFCMYCGISLKDYSKTDYDKANSGREGQDDFEDRIPCSDGNCIGIIVNGKCNVCGKPYQGS